MKNVNGPMLQNGPTQKVEIWGVSQKIEISSRFWYITPLFFGVKFIGLDRCLMR